MGDYSLHDKLAVITGGGTGIGRGIALRLARAGAGVVIVGRTEANLHSVCQEIAGLGGEGISYPGDVSRSDEVVRLAGFIKQRYGKLDILVNCAGITIKKPFLEVEEDEWDRVINTNLKSVYLCCRHLGRLIVESRDRSEDYGKIITVSSVGSYLGIPRSSAYCASKGGVLQLTKVLAVELAPNRVNVNTIVPGYIETPLSTGVLRDPNTYRGVMSRIPMAKMGKVEDTAEVVLFLSSQNSNYITGAALPVDGGLLSAAYTESF